MSLDPSVLDPSLLAAVKLKFKVEQPAAVSLVELLAHAAHVRPTNLQPQHIARWGIYTGAGFSDMAKAEASALQLYLIQHGCDANEAKATGLGDGSAALTPASYTNLETLLPDRASVRSFAQLLADLAEACYPQTALSRAGTPEVGPALDSFLSSFTNALDNTRADDTIVPRSRVTDLPETQVRTLTGILYSTARPGGFPPPVLATDQPGCRHISLMGSYLGCATATGKMPRPNVPRSHDVPYHKIYGENKQYRAGGLDLSKCNFQNQLTAMHQWLDSAEAVALSYPVPPAFAKLRTEGEDSPLPMLSGGLVYLGVRTSLARLAARFDLHPSQSAKLLLGIQDLVSEEIETASTGTRQNDYNLDTGLWAVLSRRLEAITTNIELEPEKYTRAASDGASPGASSSGAPAAGNGGASPTTTSNPQTQPKPTHGFASNRAYKRSLRTDQSGGGSQAAGGVSGGHIRKGKGRQGQSSNQQQQQQQQHPQQQQQAHPQYPQYHQYQSPQYAPPQHYPYQPAYPSPPHWAMPPAPGTTPQGGARPPSPAGAPGAPVQGAAKPVCFDWQRGACTRGAACRFSHQ